MHSHVSPVTWRPDLLLKFLLTWSAVTFIFFWVPAVCGLLGSHAVYWNFFGLPLENIVVNNWLPVTGAVVAVFIMLLGWRGARQPFHGLLILWHGFLTAGAIWLTVARPDSFVLQANIPGFEVPLAWTAAGVFGAVTILALIWVIRDFRHSVGRRLPPWNRRNIRFFGIALILLPAQFVLMHYGEPTDLTGQIGVLLTMFQWMMINMGMYPWRPSFIPKRDRNR